MNKITRANDLLMPKVTTGPVSGSRKVYTSPGVLPEGQSYEMTMWVPFREVVLSEQSGEKPFRVYDSSGPYTESNDTIDVAKGLPRTRDAWVKARGGVETYQGRDVKPEDNGNVAGANAARVFPVSHAPMRASSPSPRSLHSNGETGRGEGRPLARRLHRLVRSVPP